MKIEKASNLIEPKMCAIIYAAPGSGKTVSLALIKTKGKKLIIDIDKSSQVLRTQEAVNKIEGLKENLENIDIIEIGLDINKFLEVLKWLEDGAYKNYELICLDNISELENQMLTEYGRISKNDGAPELIHYNRTQFKIVDYVRRLRALDTHKIITAWEDREDIIYPSGEKYTQSVPKLSGKSADNVCGNCNIVAKICMGKNERYFQLERTPSVYAKDQLKGRKYCSLQNLIYEEKGEKENGKESKKEN